MSTDTVLVCGASSDIGLALLERLLAERELCVLAHCHRGAERLQRLRERFAERCLVLQADLTTSSGCDELAARVAAEQKPPTQFVHLSALPLAYERFEKLDWARLLQDFELQVGALARLLPLWLPRRRDAGSLRQVLVVSSSVTAGVPPKFLSLYTTVKYAQLGLVRALAAEYAAQGVTVNAVSPSMVETRFLDEIPHTVRELAANGSPLGRNATPDEVAEVLANLLATRRPLLNGANIVLGGGAVF